MIDSIPPFVTDEIEELLEVHGPESDEEARSLAENAADNIVSGLSIGTKVAIFEHYRMVDENPEIERELGSTTYEETTSELAIHALTVDTYHRLKNS